MLSLNDWKPLGAFIENTIRPVLDESKWLLAELDKQGFQINEKNITTLIKTISNIHFKTLIMDSIRTIIITGIICWTLWKIYPL